MEKRAEYLSIAEAATLLGVHRNTIRNRVKAGRYKAHKLLTPQGATYAIERESLGLLSDTPTNDAAQSLSRPVRHNSEKPSQPGALVSPEQQAQADAIVQRLLAPFIAELGGVREELGRVTAERESVAAQLAAKDKTLIAKDELIADLRAELRRRAERDRLTAAQAAPVGPGTSEASTEAQEAAPSVWGRLRRWWHR